MKQTCGGGLPKRLLSLLVALAMVAGLVPGQGLREALARGAGTWSADQSITATQTINGGVGVSDDITLTIAEGVTLTVNGGIDASGKTLTVSGKGTLVVVGADGANGGYGSIGRVGKAGGDGGTGSAGGAGFRGTLVVDGATVSITGGAGGFGGRGGDGGPGGDGGQGGAGVAGSVTVATGSLVVTGGMGGIGQTGGDGGGAHSDEIGKGLSGSAGVGGHGGMGGNGGMGVDGSVTLTGGTAKMAGGAGGMGGMGGSDGYGSYDGGSSAPYAGDGSDYDFGGDGGYGGDGIQGMRGKGVSGTVTAPVVEESDDNGSWSTIASGSGSSKRYVRASGLSITGVTLDVTEASLAVGDTQKLAATVSPDDATDKTVVWDVDAAAVKLYSDEECTDEVGAEATATLTVYAKGVSAGTATVTVASSTDATKSAACEVTVNDPAVLHVHDLTYAADGATITATCSADGCALEGGRVTLEIKAPTLATYGQTGDGVSAEATLSGLEAFNSATGLGLSADSITYYGAARAGDTYAKDGDALAAAPTDAGDYLAEMTVAGVRTGEGEGVAASVGYTIAPATIGVVAVAGIDAPVAGEALDAEATTGTERVTLRDSGAVGWEPASSAGKAAHATAYTATVTAVADKNHAFADEVTATVNGEPATVAKNDDGTLSISFAFAKTALAPVEITAADKEVTFSPDGVAVPVDGMFAVPEGAGTPTFSVTNGTGEGTYDAQTGRLSVTRCGTFAVRVGTAATDTHEAGSASATLTVRKADNPIACEGQSVGVTFSTSAQRAELAEATGAVGAVGYAMLSQENASGAEVSHFGLQGSTLTIAAGVPAGEYVLSMRATATGDDNHEEGFDDFHVTVRVAKATNPATVTGAASVMRGGNAVDLAGNVAPNGAEGAVTYQIAGDALGCALEGGVLTSGDKTGTVTVSVMVAADDNHEALEATPITVTVTKKGTQTIAADDVAATYGDAGKSISARVADPAEGGGAISYAVKEGSEDYIGVDAETGALTIKAVPADGKARVTVTAAETATLERATKDVTVTIDKADPSVTAPKAKNLTYDGAEQALVEGGSAEGGELQYALGGAGEAPAEGWGASVPKATDAGTYRVWYRVTGDANHVDAAPECVDVAVAPRVAKLAWSDTSFAYDGKAHQPKAVVANLVEGDKCTVTVAGAGTDAGSHTATATGLSNPNYELPAKAAKRFTVARAKLTGIAKVAAQPYTGKAITPVPTVKAGKATLKVGTDFTYSYKANTKAGTATVIAKGKGNYAGSVSTTFKIVCPSVQYYAHVQTTGDEPEWSKHDGQTSGTVGKGKRLEALRLRLGSSPVSGSIQYRGHVQRAGWERSWSKDGALSGTAGQSRRLEAVQIRLTGQMARLYDVYYRVHSQRYGWMGWAKNGAMAGTTGMSLRLEAYQVVVVPKGAQAPGATYHGATQGHASPYVAS